jgi:hypothetical protein
MTCLCQECNWYFKMDLLISDDLWKKIKPINKKDGSGLLCPKCIVKKIEQEKGYSAFKLEEI